jgi:hypothetical protein
VLRGFLTYAAVTGARVPQLLVSLDEACVVFAEVERWLALQKTIEIETGRL